MVVNMDEFNWWEVVKGLLLILTAIFNSFVLPMLVKLTKKVDSVETNTNGMHTELVETTKALGLSVGHAKGVADQKKKAGVRK